MSQAVSGQWCCQAIRDFCFFVATSLYFLAARVCLSSASCTEMSDIAAILTQYNRRRMNNVPTNGGYVLQETAGLPTYDSIQSDRYPNLGSQIGQGCSNGSFLPSLRLASYRDESTRFQELGRVYMLVPREDGPVQLVSIHRQTRHDARQGGWMSWMSSCP